MAETEILYLTSEAVQKALDNQRRDIVGGLIRWIKDNDPDLMHLLFNYVHVYDYGQAMVEGWGELYGLLTTTHERIGPFGLPYDRFGAFEQAILADIWNGSPNRDEETAKRIEEAMTRLLIHRKGSLFDSADADYIESMVRTMCMEAGIADLLDSPAAEGGVEDDLF